MGGAVSMEPSAEAAKKESPATTPNAPAQAVVPKEETRKHTPKAPEAAATRKEDHHHGTEKKKEEGAHAPKTEAAKKSKKDSKGEKVKKEKKHQPNQITYRKDDEPIAIPVNGRMVYIVGHKGSLLILQYVPKGATEPILVSCPAAHAQVFIEHIDDYGYPDPEAAILPTEEEAKAATAATLPHLPPPPSYPATQLSPARETTAPCAELPPPSYSPMHQALMASVPAVAAPQPQALPTVVAAPMSEDEALALAIAQSLSIKDDVRNYDLSPPPSNFAGSNRVSASLRSRSDRTASDVMSAFDIREDISHQLRERPRPPVSASRRVPVPKVAVPATASRMEELPPPSYSAVQRQTQTIGSEAYVTAS